MNEKALIIRDVANLLLNGKNDKARSVLSREYPYGFNKVQERKYTDSEKIRIFFRDGFIDRYTGDRLVIPGMLKVLSYYFPEKFPYHPHWKMEETHIAYWELVPTIDHVIPIALGGDDNEENWVTTSMLHNAVKSNWTLEQIGWNLVERGDLEEWDGLARSFIDIVDADTQLLDDQYISKWYRLAKRK